MARAGVTRLLALDLSLTASGVVDPDGQAETLRPPKGLTGAFRLEWWHTSFRVLLDQYQPDQIVIEKGFAGMRGDSTGKLQQQVGVFLLAVQQHGRPIVITWVPPATLKKAWTGFGNATKDQMRASALFYGHNCVALDDNAIDAFALWSCCRAGMFAA